MGHVVILLILSLLLFGNRFEKRADDYIMDIYETHVDQNAFKTHFVIYSFTYWVGAIALASLLSAAQYATNNLVMAIASIIVFAIFAKITRLFYSVAAIREKSLMQYIDN